jgi:hypothetical protein
VNQTYTCPVCGFDQLDDPPVDEDGDGLFEICPSCGFQFGVTDDDKGFTYESWRSRWVGKGMPWDSEGIEPPPEGWDPKRQLEKLLGGNTE